MSAAWTTSEHFLASALELLQETNVLLLKGLPLTFEGDAPTVHRIPRPGRTEELEVPSPAPTINDWRRALIGTRP